MQTTIAPTAPAVQEGRTLELRAWALRAVIVLAVLVATLVATAAASWASWESGF